jgi:hypothetical protein
MGGTKIPPKFQIYEIVAEHLVFPKEENFDTKQYVHTIANSALLHLKSVHSNLKKERAKIGHPEENLKEKLISAVNNVLISSKSPWKPTLCLTENKIQNLFFQIMRSGNTSTEGIFGTLLKAVILKKNPQLLKEGRDLLQNIFINMMDEIMKLQAQGDRFSETESFHMEMVIGDLLSLFPFLRPQNGEELKVPLRINNTWQLISYKIHQINLTPEWMGSPIVAIGLEPAHPQHSPLLIFKGTTYPTDKGFSLSLITDVNPLSSVGNYAFRLGKKKIEQWLNRFSDKKTILFGKSLGGAQAWRTAIHFPEKVEKVMAYGAPGLSSVEVKKWNAIHRNHSSIPNINMFCQKGDLTPFQDKAVKKGFNYFLVLGEKPYKGISSHAHMFSTHKHSIILRMNDSEIAGKWKRIRLTLIRTLMSFILFPFLIIVHAIQTALKKICRAIKNIKSKKAET